MNHKTLPHDSRGPLLSRDRIALLPRASHASDRRELARGPHSSIEVCMCGAMHLNLGGVSVRLPLESLYELRALFDIGEGVLDALRFSPSTDVSVGQGN